MTALEQVDAAIPKANPQPSGDRIDGESTSVDVVAEAFPRDPLDRLIGGFP